MKTSLTWQHLKVTFEAEGQEAVSDMTCLMASVISTAKQLNYGYGKFDIDLEHKKIESTL